MTRRRLFLFGAPLLVLVLVLLAAGCSQPSGAPVGTTTPTATATTQKTVPATSTPVATTTVRPDNQTLKTEMAALAGTLAQTIDRQNLSTALREGENSTALAVVLNQIRAFKADNPQIIHDYVLEQKNGTVVIVIAGEYGEPGAPGFREPYLDPPVELKTPVTGPIGIGPYTDEYGTFISGLAPIDLGSNTSVILAGVDYKV